MNRLMSIIKNWYLLITLQVFIAIFSYLHFNNDTQKLPISDGSDSIKVYSPDWGISADLISLGVNPVAIANQKEYKNWVSTPSIPKSAIEVGLRYQPNPELMASLDLDIIIDNGFYINTRDIYNKNIDIQSVEYGRDSEENEPPKWSTFSQDVAKLGTYTDKSQIAKNYVLNSKKEIAQSGSNIKKILGDNKQFLIVSIFDISELQVYNTNHPISLAMEEMDLKLLPMGKIAKWGLSAVPFHKIHDVPEDTCLVIVEPINPFVEFELKESLIWQQSSFSQNNSCTFIVKPIWMYGGFSTIKNFAVNLEQEVTKSNKNNLNISNLEGTK